MLQRPLLVAAVLSAAVTLAACGSSDATATNSGSSGSAGSSGSSTASAESSESPASSGVSCTYKPDGSGGDIELPPAKAAKSGKVPVTINSSVGDLKLTLDADHAPCTVNSFVSLAKQGFYDGIYCHRIGDPAQFPMLQCGDPTAKDPASLAAAGTGGPGYSFADELTGAEKYGAGTLAMANAGPDTNGSQFFMVFGDIGLSPDYTVFGTIDAATLTTLKKVAAAGNNGSNGDGTGAPNTPVRFTGVTVG
ncbi:peptidylprolyl isomerase [Nocardioides sp. AN3]